MSFKGIVDFLHSRILSEKVKANSEKVILIIAISSYLIHLFLIFLNLNGIIHIESKFFKDPIAAIYTPFTFILVYEVFLLIYFLPKSISSYIGKQYEIITLIVIRRIFKDIAALELSDEWFQLKNDLQFTYDVLTSLILFLLIYLFYSKVLRVEQSDETPVDPAIQRFITLKKGLSVLLVPILLILAGYSLVDWILAVIHDYENGVIAFKNINHIFFNEFFTVLIVVDVLLLLSSFFYSDQFHKIIRNSGFVISTMLIKLSFTTEGLLNSALIVGAVCFGFVILLVHNKYESYSKQEKL